MQKVIVGSLIAAFMLLWAYVALIEVGSWIISHPSHPPRTHVDRPVEPLPDAPPAGGFGREGGPR